MQNIRRGLSVFAFIFAFVVISTVGIAGPAECVNAKIADLKSVTKSNTAAKLRKHFSIDFLASQVVGGGLKWKNMSPAEQQPIRDLFSNTEIIGELYDNLKDYKNVTSVVFRPVNARTPGRIIALLTAAGKRHILIFTFAKNSCTLLNLCKGNICVSDLFRVNRSRARKKVGAGV